MGSGIYHCYIVSDHFLWMSENIDSQQHFRSIAKPARCKDTSILNKKSTLHDVHVYVTALNIGTKCDWDSVQGSRSRCGGCCTAWSG